MGRSKSTKNRVTNTNPRNATKNTTKNSTNTTNVIPDEQERRDGPGGN